MYQFDKFRAGDFTNKMTGEYMKAYCFVSTMLHSESTKTARWLVSLNSRRL